jgi:hypothetical protein
MGKHKHPHIGFFIPKEIIERLDYAKASTGAKTRTELLLVIVLEWLDKNEY